MDPIKFIEAAAVVYVLTSDLILGSSDGTPQVVARLPRTNGTNTNRPLASLSEANGNVLADSSRKHFDS
jgi:hypothetical protein